MKKNTMKHMKIIKMIGFALAIFLSVFIFMNSGALDIRVENASDYDFDEVIINIRNYGSILSGEKSDYKKMEGAHTVCFYIKVRINDKEFLSRPKDCIGSVRMPRGKYTLILKLNLDIINGKLSGQIYPYRVSMIDYFIKKLQGQI